MKIFKFEISFMTTHSVKVSEHPMDTGHIWHKTFGIHPVSRGYMISVVYLHLELIRKSAASYAILRP